jgi:hypothetical protein
MFVTYISNSPIHKSKAGTQKIASMRSTHRILIRHISFFLDILSKTSSVKNLFEARREAFDHRSKSVLDSVVDEWLVHLRTYIDYEDSYFPEG